jgi:polysaccharide export outer membrane protein
MRQDIATAGWKAFLPRLVQAAAAPSAALLWVTLLAGCASSSDSAVPTDFSANAAATEPAATSAPADASAKAALSDLHARVSPAATPGESGYLIGPRDVIGIEVFKVPDLTRSVQVAETGTVNLPLLGEVRASGKSAQQLERDLTARFGGRYLKDPQVTVKVVEYNSQRVTIEGGGSKKPGVYPLREKNTLLDMMAQSGGIDPDVGSSDVVVFRRDENGMRTAGVFDVDAIRAGTAQDPVMQPGDLILVDTSTAKVTANRVLKYAGFAMMFKPF